ncbi:MAG: DNA translocase FtsK [Kiritimatiellaeota bacterium]|nr:DNA translocase FtsK [Kiritimatiellota bacterium]
MAESVAQKGEKEAESEHVFKFRHVFLMIFILLLVLSLFSHSAGDLNVLAGGVDGPVNNWIGPVGAQIARAAFYLFGLASYPMALFLAVCALRPLLPVPVKRKGYVGALVAVVIGATIMFAMYPQSLCGLTQKIGIGHSKASAAALSGGVLGQKIAAPLDAPAPGILIRYIGGVGTFVVAAVFLCAGLFFIWLADWRGVWRAYRGVNEEVKVDKNAFSEQKSDERETSNASIDPERERIREELRQGNRDVSTEEDEPDDAEGGAFPPTPVQQRPARQPGGALELSGYTLPPLSLLLKSKQATVDNSDFVRNQKEILQSTLDSFGLDATVTGAVVGPRVTRYEITPEPGVRVEKISAITNNIAMDLQAKSIRILAPIPGKNAVGVEAANKTSSSVSIRSMMESDNWTKGRQNIPIILGKDVTGKVEVADLAKSPHLLIAGATGSGKSVCINTLIMSLLYHFSPTDLRLIMVDPKVVEFEVYKTLPHLITPIVNDPHKVPAALRWAINEMERRYKMLSKVGVRNLEDFNSRKLSPEDVLDDDGKSIPDKLPYIVILIDELADIMMIAKAEVETSIARIAQKARAVGIHMVLATQTPRKDIITGVIKANLPSRIAFRVGGQVDSRVILDKKGADALLGQGDMLFLPPGSAELERIQGSWVSDEEIKAVVSFVSDQAEQSFFDGVIVEEDSGDGKQGGSARPDDGALAGVSPKLSKYLRPEDDDNMKRALEIILAEGKASTSYIQRRLKIGYNRAADIIDQLEERGIIGPAPSTGGANREILVDLDDE